jgi:hypothetical protein
MALPPYGGFLAPPLRTTIPAQQHSAYPSDSQQGETPRSCHYPEIILLPSKGQSCLNARPCSIEHTIITMLPDSPSTQNN